MPSEPARPLSPTDLPTNHLVAEAPVDLRALRQAVRRELRRRQTRIAGSNVAGDPIAVFGFDGRDLARLSTAVSAAPDSLLGLHVGAEHRAVVAMAASVMTAADRSHADAILAVTVTRDGHELCFLAGDDGIVETWQPQGWLVDACRRSLGLPTRSSDARPVDLSLALWLDYLLVALVEHRAVSWSDAVACCPVMASSPGIAPDELGELLASGVPSWSALRAAAASGAPLPVPVRPEHAAWMDDAMFARWVLGFFPELDDLRSDIEFLAAPDVAESVERTVRSARSR